MKKLIHLLGVILIPGLIFGVINRIFDFGFSSIYLKVFLVLLLFVFIPLILWYEKSKNKITKRNYTIKKSQKIENDKNTTSKKQSTAVTYSKKKSGINYSGGNIFSPNVNRNSKRTFFRK